MVAGVYSEYCESLEMAEGRQKATGLLYVQLSNRFGPLLWRCSI